MKELDIEVKDKIDNWLRGNYDDNTKAEINKLLENRQYDELTDAFYKDLEFGTGGLRGIMGTGSNRMNKYTIGMATQGFSNYLKKVFHGEKIKVAIAYDNRNNSDYFAAITADVFSANGIKVYYFKELRPTPELSFAIRQLKCHGGVMLTASHNPKEYNGYKAYWNDGGQLISPHDKNIIEEVNRIKSIEQVNFNRNNNNIELTGEEIDKKYLETLVALSVSPAVIKRQSNLKIVFSSIHGTGITMVPQALERFGFTNIIIVEEQATPDGNFPTVIFPNPEEEEAMTLALNKAKETNAELVLATDPDGDRVGVAVKNNNNEFELLNGNQIGSLIIHYLINAWHNAGKLTGNEYIVKTIVTTSLIDEIAKANNIECYNVLTGFKHIGALITKLEGKKTFIGGGEESYGYLIGEHVRDKDAVISSAIIAEIAAYYKDIGKTLFDALLDIYIEHGFYKEKLISLTKKGKAGAEEINNIMQQLRNEPPANLASLKIIKIKDYYLSLEKDLNSGEEIIIELPKSDVLQFYTEDGSVISARPSGTEPKIKFYCSVRGNLNNKNEYETIAAALD